MLKTSRIESNKIEALWQTKDGTFIAVTEMGDSHIVNTIRMLRRSVSTFQTSDAAEMAMGTEDYDVACPTLPALLAEAKKRKLEIGESK